jgi:Cdc6-like AAA superfamily ATPase
MNNCQKPGLIVIGYPGIGKSTVAKSSHNNIIDFESSLFYINNIRQPDWYKIYAKQATELAKQGYIVLVSSHKEVRDEFAKYIPNSAFDIVTIAPAYNLEKEWINKLRERYIADSTQKNFVAYMNVMQHYYKDISDMASDTRFSHIFIDSMDYILEKILSDVGPIFNFGRIK